jgi:hypothetical protein
MKTKITLIALICSFLLASCFKDEDRFDEGFSFYITNNAQVFENAEIVIGGFLNDEFVPTDSIKFDKIELREKHYFFDANRWKPSLNKIRAIPSEHCYFKFKLSPQREEFVKVYNQNDLMSLLLPSEDFFIGNYGRLIIAMNNNEVTGRAAEEL